MPRNAGKAIRVPDDLHAEVARAADDAGETIAEYTARALRREMGGARASVTVPTTRARTPRRPGPEVTAKCPHPMSVRIGNRCGRCGQAVR
jgi:hypothetical protein